MDNSNSFPELSRLKSVTIVSKYLALILFVSLPFIGAYVGYQFAPIQIVEIEKTSSPVFRDSTFELSRFLFDYEAVQTGQIIEGFEVLEKNEQPYITTMTLRSAESVGKKLEGKLTAFYTEYSGDYMLSFTPYTDSYDDIPYPQNIDIPGSFIVSQIDSNVEVIIDGVCGDDCTPIPTGSDVTRDLFVKQATIYVRDIRYVVENDGIDSLGHEIIAQKIEVSQ